MKRWLAVPVGSLVVLLVVGGCQMGVYHRTDRGVLQVKPRIPLVIPLNRWETTLEGSIREVHKAILSGLKDLKIAPITNRVDTVSGYLDGLFSDGKDLDIRMTEVGDGLTKVSIRCGLGASKGDRERAMRVFRAIEPHL